jgi:LacI family transcriptional regulator
MSDDGRPAVRIWEVAMHAGVAASTVSNVLNRPEIVAPATRARVEQAIAALGFVPNASARHLRRGRGTVLGLVLLDLSNPFFIDVARGVDDAARAAGMSVIVCNSDEQPGREAGYLDVLEEQRVRGVIITPVDDVNERLLRLRRHGIQVVLLDRHADRDDLCSVAVDNRLGGELAAAHLIEEGHRRLAFLGGPWRLEQVRARYHGALTALEQAGLGQDHLRYLDGPPPPTKPMEVGRDAVSRILGLPVAERPTAVFCASDRVALGMLQGLTQHRLRVPDDIALIGYDDIEIAAAAAVPLSSVRQPRYELGRAAAELLIDETEHPASHTHQQLVFKPELVVRQSSQRG